MNREDFLTYLSENACMLVRTDKRGYSVVRNVITSRMSGVPIDDPLYMALVCRICKTLGIEPPACAVSAVDIVERAHKKHGGK
jgi:hypothetical protein